MGLARCLTYKCGEDGSLILAFGVGDGASFQIFLVAPVFLGVHVQYMCYVHVCLCLLYIALRNVVRTIYEFLCTCMIF